MNKTLTDLLLDGVTMVKCNPDGTIERCTTEELEGKDLELVSVHDFSYQELKKEFEED